MVNKAETDNFLTSENKNSPSNSNSCFSKWWNQDYHHQKKICGILESMVFRALVIFLVVADASLVITEIMLDSLKLHDECLPTKDHHTEKMNERIELIGEIAHYSSIAILVFFVIELILKIYAFANEFWNIRKKKMEYFDAFIVITSLMMDLYLLRVEEKRLAKHLFILVAFRLWRFVRIVSSVAEGIEHRQEKHKKHLNKTYLIAIRRVIDIVIQKTDYIEQKQNNGEININSILEYFRRIDNQCKLSLVQLDENSKFNTSVLVNKFIKQLEDFENSNNNKNIPATFEDSSEV